jgi:SAM-dependent methyltransferase
VGAAGCGSTLLDGHSFRRRGRRALSGPREWQPRGSVGKVLRLNSLPPRYDLPWKEPFDELVSKELRSGIQVLDVGCGRNPSLNVEFRPLGCQWVALDISSTELKKAPPGSYDSLVIANVECPIPELMERFDLIVSWQVLEHVRYLDQGLHNLHSYLRPKGRLVAMVSGQFAFFALVNKVLPHRVVAAAMHHLLGQPPESVFPAHYTHCTYSALHRLLSDWHDVEVVPLFRGGPYLRFSAPLQKAYIAYENLVVRKDWRDLATHYLIAATK